MDDLFNTFIALSLITTLLTITAIVVTIVIIFIDRLRMEYPVIFHILNLIILTLIVILLGIFAFAIYPKIYNDLEDLKLKID